jgi:hypothetical protein
LRVLYFIVKIFKYIQVNKVIRKLDPSWDLCSPSTYKIYQHTYIYTDAKYFRVEDAYKREKMGMKPWMKG